MNIYFKLTVSTLVLFLTSCAHLYFDSSVDFSLFGEANPQAEKAVVEKFKQYYFERETVKTDHITILVDSIPDGFSMKDNQLSANHSKDKVIGKTKFRSPTAYPTKEQVILSAKQLTAAAGGNLAIISYIKYYDDPRKIWGFEGFIVQKSAGDKKQSSPQEKKI